MNTPLRQAFWVLLAAGLLGGCNSFSDRYRTAVASPPSPGQILGAWEGTWQSEANEHTGKLRAIVTRVGHGVYNVQYSAEYSDFLPSFDHATTLKGHHTGATFHFTGGADLGFLAGGVYEYAGYATPDEFYSTYQSKDDHGTYTLSRPGATPPQDPADEKANARETHDFHNLAIEALDIGDAPPSPNRSSPTAP